MTNPKTKYPVENTILEKGYRPIGTVNTQHPPKGGSGVPAKPPTSNPQSPQRTS